MNMDDPETSAREDDASRIAARAGDLRRAILQHPDGTRPATAGEVAALLALVERLANLLAGPCVPAPQTPGVSGGVTAGV